MRGIPTGIGKVLEAGVLAERTPAVQVDWKPPAEGDPSLAHILNVLRRAYSDRIQAANQEAIRRMEALGRLKDSDK